MLAEFFTPQSVAVVGASRDPGKVGHAVFANLLQGGFEGPVYPVNPSAPDVMGQTAYPSLSALPAVVDLAIVVVPAARATEVIAECGTLGIPAVPFWLGVLPDGTVAFRMTGQRDAAALDQIVSLLLSAG